MAEEASSQLVAIVLNPHEADLIKRGLAALPYEPTERLALTLQAMGAST